MVEQWWHVEEIRRTRLKALKTHFLLDSDMILLATKATIPRQRLAGQHKRTLVLALDKSKN